MYFSPIVIIMYFFNHLLPEVGTEVESCADFLATWNIGDMFIFPQCQSLLNNNKFTSYAMLALIHQVPLVSLDSYELSSPKKAGFLFLLGYRGLISEHC
jgi:hypothetical protein